MYEFGLHRQFKYTSPNKIWSVALFNASFMPIYFSLYHVLQIARVYSVWLYPNCNACLLYNNNTVLQVNRIPFSYVCTYITYLSGFQQWTLLTWIVLNKYANSTLNVLLFILLCACIIFTTKTTNKTKTLLFTHTHRLDFT